MDVRAEVVDILAGFALFADLSTPELENLVDSFEEQMFNDGERVVRQGLSSAMFYVIVDGAALVRVSGTDRNTLRAGDFFGEISCLLGEPPVADIIARGQLRCLVLPGESLEEFLVGHPRVLFRVLLGEARKLRNTTQWRT